MVHAPDDPDDEAPLDPALVRVRARLRRLMLIAGLTLGVGIFAVFAAILYRIVTLDTSTPAEAWAPGSPVPTVRRDDLGLPDDAILASFATDAGRILLGYRHAGGESLVILDAASQAVIGRLEVVDE